MMETKLTVDSSNDKKLVSPPPLPPPKKTTLAGFSLDGDSISPAR